METIVDLVIIAAAILVLLMMFRFYRQSSIGVVDEVGAPLFEERCGARIGAVNISYPFVRHAIYPGFILIAYGKSRHVIPRKDLVDAQIKKGVVFKCLHYEWIGSGAHQRCLVWSRSPEKVLTLLEQQIMIAHV